MRTSVVIPAYAAQETLPAVLEMLAPQMRAGRETIVVLNGTQASTGALHPESRPWLRILVLGQRVSPGRARNLGVAAAGGELLAFLDADAIPGPNWLDELEAALRPGLDAVAGRILNGTPHSRIGTAEYLLTCSEVFRRRPRPIRHACGASLLIRRVCFEAAGEFREDLPAGEDTVLTYPLARRRRLGFAASAPVTHLNRTRLRPFLNNQQRQGAGFVAVCRLVGYPHRWVGEGPALILAGPLRLGALARCVMWNPRLIGPACRSAVPLILGSVAWNIGALRARRRHADAARGAITAAPAQDHPPAAARSF